MATFVDDYSRSCATFYMAHKSDTFATFKQFHAKVPGETGERIGVLKPMEVDVNICPCKVLSKYWNKPFIGKISMVYLCKSK